MVLLIDHLCWALRPIYHSTIINFFWGASLAKHCLLRGQPYIQIELAA